MAVSDTPTPGTSEYPNAVTKKNIIAEMKKNSAKYNASTDEAEKAQLMAANQTLGKSLGATYNSITGTWFDPQTGRYLYDYAESLMSSHIQDIHIEDKDIWAQFQTKYKAGDYAGAWQLIADTQFGNKKDVASIWNQIAADLVYVQGLDDPDFGSGKIRVAATIPDDIKDGEVWFQLTNETDGLITIQQCTSATNKTNDTLYPKTIATNVLGGSDMTAYPISPKNADAAISKLADGLYDVSMTRRTKKGWEVDSPAVDLVPGFRKIVGFKGRFFGLERNELHEIYIIVGNLFASRPLYIFGDNPVIDIACDENYICFYVKENEGSYIYSGQTIETLTKNSTNWANVIPSSLTFKMYCAKEYGLIISWIYQNNCILRVSSNYGQSFSNVQISTITGGFFNAPPYNIIAGKNTSGNTIFVLSIRWVDNSASTSYTYLFYSNSITSGWTSAGGSSTHYDGTYTQLEGDGTYFAMASYSPPANTMGKQILYGSFEDIKKGAKLSGPNGISHIAYGMGYWWFFSTASLQNYDISIMKLQNVYDSFEDILVFYDSGISPYLYSSDITYTIGISISAIDEANMRMVFARKEPLLANIEWLNKLEYYDAVYHTLTFKNAKGNTLLSAQID